MPHVSISETYSCLYFSVKCIHPHIYVECSTSLQNLNFCREFVLHFSVKCIDLYLCGLFHGFTEFKFCREYVLHFSVKCIHPHIYVNSTELKLCRECVLHFSVKCIHPHIYVECSTSLQNLNSAENMFSISL